jgi:hypothetical protein
MLVDKFRQRNNSAGNTPLNLRKLFPTFRLLLAVGNNQRLKRGFRLNEVSI